MASAGFLRSLSTEISSCLDSQAAHGCVRSDQSLKLVQAVLDFGQAELVGNRALDPCLWAVVEATERAYPLLLSASLDKARHTAQQLGLEADVEALSQIWVLQGAADGCLAIWAGKVLSQPHIYSAYRPRAPLRNREQVMEFCAAVDVLKGLHFQPLPREFRRGGQLKPMLHISDDYVPDATSAAPARTDETTSTIAEEAVVNMCLTVTEALSSAEAESVRVCLLVTAPLTRDNRNQEEASANSIEQCDKDEEPLRQSGHHAGGNWHAALEFLRQKVESSPLANITSRTPVSCTPERDDLPLGASDLPGEALGLHGTSSSLTSPNQQHQSPAMSQQSAAGPVAVHMEVTSSVENPAICLRLEVKEESGKALGVAQQPARGRLRGMTDQAKSVQASIASAASKLQMPVLPSVSWLLGKAEGQADAAQPKYSAPCTEEAVKRIPSSSQQPEAASSSAGISVTAQDSGGADSEIKSNDNLSVAAEPQLTDESKMSFNAGEGTSAQQQQRMEGMRSTGWLFSKPMLGYFRPSEKAAGDRKKEPALQDSHQPSLTDMTESPTDTAAMGSERDDIAVDNDAIQTGECESLSPPEALMIETGVELKQGLEGTALDLLDAALEARDPIASDDLRVTRLCSLVVAFLHHGLNAQQAAASGTWAPYLYSSRQTPPVYALLEEAQKMESMLDDTVRSSSATSHGRCQEHLEDWVLNEIKNHVLGSRLLSLSRNEELLRRWYSREALFRQDGVVGTVLGLLCSLDGISISDATACHSPSKAGLSICKPTGADEDADAATSHSLFHKVGSLLMSRPAAQLHASVDSTTPPPALSREGGTERRPLLPKSSKRKPSRSVDISICSQPEHSPAVVPEQDAFATPAASLGLLSPLSSTELSAEPLSAAILASFLAARNHAATLASARPPPHGSAWQTSALPTDPLAIEATKDLASVGTHRHSDFLDALLADNGSTNSASSGVPNLPGMLLGIRQAAEDDSPLHTRVESRSAAPGGAAAALNRSHAHDQAETASISEETASTSVKSHAQHQQAHDALTAKSCPEAASDQGGSGVEQGDALTSQHRAESAEPPDGDDRQKGCMDADAPGEGKGQEGLSGQGHQSGTQLDTCNSMLLDMDEVLANWPSDAPRWEGQASHLDHVPMHIRNVSVTVDDKDSGGKSFTQFLIKVHAEDFPAWTVARRFRDFAALATELRGMYGSSLPTAWDDIIKARAVTGARRLDPVVVSARQAMLQRCLAEALAAGPPVSTSPALLAFLSSLTPRNERDQTNLLGHHDSSLVSPEGAASSLSTSEEVHRYGSTVRLITALPAQRSEPDLLSLQRGLCAGCREALPPAKSSWIHSSTGPRRCCYNGLLYCSDCHSNATALIPALVLHHWDFTLQPVSSIAREYLASIAEQPLLCIGAINPGLYARVPLLARAHRLRQSASKALAAAKRAGSEPAAQVERLSRSAGQRRHLLESADFWALRDLVELSRGAFSELPQWLESAAGRSTKIATSALLTSQPTPNEAVGSSL